MRLDFSHNVYLFAKTYPNTRGGELQFDLYNGDGRSILTNLNVGDAKMLRKRLDDFIRECDKTEVTVTVPAHKVDALNEFVAGL